MPTTRRPLARKRNASFTPEVLRLFLELENSPRRGKRFEADGRRLMQLPLTSKSSLCWCPENIRSSTAIRSRT